MNSKIRFLSQLQNSFAGQNCPFQLAPLIFLLFFIILPFQGKAAPVRAADGEWKKLIDTLNLKVNNHETELRILEERLNNQCETTDELQQKLDAQYTKQKETVNEQLSHVRLSAKDFSQDLKTLHDRLQELVGTLNAQEKKMAQLEKNLGHLQSALQSILGALEINTINASNSENIYIVKNGDSLEKIAKKHQMTVQMLKDMNQLTNDRIIVGQKLYISRK